MRWQEHISLVILLLGTLITSSAGCSSPIYVQEFEPTWEPLRQHGCPAWFRDAKLGHLHVLGPLLGASHRRLVWAKHVHRRQPPL